MPPLSFRLTLPKRAPPAAAGSPAAAASENSAPAPAPAPARTAAPPSTSSGRLGKLPTKRGERGRSGGQHFKPGVIGFSQNRSLKPRPTPVVVVIVGSGVRHEHTFGVQQGCSVRHCGSSEEVHFVEHHNLHKFEVWLPPNWREHKDDEVFCSGVRAGLLRLASSSPADAFESSLQHRAEQAWMSAFSADQALRKHGGEIPDIPPFPFVM